MIRQPAVAGTFYPANPQQLQNIIEQYLSEAVTSDKVPKVIITPHAGYVYSGPIAASAYSRLMPAHHLITRVVVIGPSHHVVFRGLAVSRARAFSTPLGDIQVDQQAVQAIEQLPFVEYIEQAHAFEHSVEVQLPFLQEVLDDFKIVPIVAGDATPEQVSEVLEILWGGPETLIVISSDLSHYHDYATAKQLDKATSQAIENLHFEEIGNDSACGRVPVNGMLKLARDKSLEIRTIDLRNSGDTAGDKQRVVGYGAYVID